MYKFGGKIRTQSIFYVYMLYIIKYNKGRWHARVLCKNEYGCASKYCDRLRQNIFMNVYFYMSDRVTTRYCTRALLCMYILYGLVKRSFGMYMCLIAIY